MASIEPRASPSGVTWPGMKEMVEKLQHLKAETMVITDLGNREAIDASRHSLVIPLKLRAKAAVAEDLFTPIPYIIPAQLFAASLATQKGLDPDRPTLLVTGGSQGAQALNLAASGAAARIAAAGVQVLHAAGPKNVVTVRVPETGPPYVVVPYVERMDLAYAAADLALCRAGAMTCAELTAVGLPAAYVPLPHGNGEQRLNAEPIVAAGGGLLVENAQCTPDWIVSTLLPVLTDPGRLAAMSAAATSLGHPDADVALARLVLSVARAEPVP